MVSAMNAHTHSSVEQFFTAFADAWETNEGEAVAALFVDDGALINPFGQRADGRTAIVGMYSDYFAGMLKGTSTRPSQLLTARSFSSFT
jgi:uncharacterized protein (TIGR02246 family)